MPALHEGVYVTSVPGLVAFFILWFGLVEVVKVLISFLRSDPLVGWGISPLGISLLYVREPSTPFILFKTILPALLSGCILYVGLFTTFPSPLSLPHQPLLAVVVIIGGVLLSSWSDVVSALRDLRHPLWGEARMLQMLQTLHMRRASIHFTPFGISYLRDQFASSPSELLQAF